MCVLNSEDLKKRSTTTFLGLRGGATVLKNQISQKAHLKFLLNLLVKFQPTSSIWRGDMSETTRKIRKNDQETTQRGRGEGLIRWLKSKDTE